VVVVVTRMMVMVVMVVVVIRVVCGITLDGATRAVVLAGLYPVPPTAARLRPRGDRTAEALQVRPGMTWCRIRKLCISSDVNDILYSRE
jgi:hypothetical protein